MRKVPLWAGLLFILMGSPAAGQPMAEGAFHGSLAGATAGYPFDAWGANPAAWHFVQSPTLIFFGSRGFGLSALQLGSARAIWPFSKASIAAGIHQYGNPQFGEQRFLIGAAHDLKLNLPHPIALGWAVERQRYQITAYPTKARWKAKLGWLIPVSPAIHIGLIYHSKLRGSGDENRLDAGISGIMGPNFSWMAALSYQAPHPASLRLGFAIAMIEEERHAIEIRGGISTNPESFSVGLGIRLNSIKADLAGAHHLILGWTPGLSITLLKGGKA